MQSTEQTVAALGNEAPLVADGRVGPPDRREISARWLSGAVLTGLTSTVLMGVALFAALDGREQLAVPPDIAQLDDMTPDPGESVKASRVALPRPVAKARDRRRMDVSTVSRVGDHDVVKMVPLVEISMALAAGHTTDRAYPPFDPLNVFGADDDGKAEAQAAAVTGQIYGAKAESGITLKTVDFPLDADAFDEKSTLSADEVESVVRSTRSILTDGGIQVASLHYVDPERFGVTLASAGALAAPFARVVQENVSVARRMPAVNPSPGFLEDVIPVREAQPVAEALSAAGYSGDDADRIAARLDAMRGGDELESGEVICVGLETRGDAQRLVRAGVYKKNVYQQGVALNDRGEPVEAAPPDLNPDIALAFDDAPAPVRARADLPTIYDGVYRTAFSYGMSGAMTGQLIKLLASDVDFQSRLSPTDKIDVLFSQPDGDDQASESSELLYMSSNLGGATRHYYRFQMDDSTVDYFDENGRSAQQFLLRKAVPNGRFTSGFGARRHPILGYVRMHPGVDWAAPVGTPIIAAGNGVVEKAGWAGGYGKQTIVRHANGYETSYNHQSAFAKGITPGSRVRQGQVIGYIGTTGLSTGPHLHFELIVNGRKVDPMRVRLPGGRALQGKDLEKFRTEKDRIDALLKERDNAQLKVASR